MGVSAEVILFVGGGVVTIAVGVFVVVLLVRASREHDRVIAREKQQRLDQEHLS